MARFVIVVTRTEDNIQPFMYKAFKVSDNLDAQDVTFPFNTVYFTFVHANTNSVEELLSTFLTVQIGNHVSLSSSLELTYEDKRYWVGKIVSYEGNKFLYNKEINVLVPLNIMSDYDEVIDS